MNCKPNDMARIISDEDTRAIGIADRIVQVTHRAPDVEETGRPCWFYAPPKLLWAEGRGGYVNRLPDDVLRPIRDPGDDAVDEMVLRVPAPGSEVTA